MVTPVVWPSRHQWLLPLGWPVDGASCQASANNACEYAFFRFCFFSGLMENKDYAGFSHASFRVPLDADCRCLTSVKQLFACPIYGFTQLSLVFITFWIVPSTIFCIGQSNP
jgi:hypothetical protein